MPYKIGRKTKTKGWTIMRYKNGKWEVVGHSKSRKMAQASIRARGMHGKGGK